jgi:hypothetical protein
VSKLEDFAYIRDATALLAFQELGLIDKGVISYRDNESYGTERQGTAHVVGHLSMEQEIQLAS